MKKLIVLGITCVLGCGTVQAQSASALTNGWLEFVGVLLAPTYDPEQSQIPRRRPGHAWNPRVIAPAQNPDALDPAPVNLAGEFIPVPDRWRIMESLGYQHPWYDPYNFNVLKGDRPLRGE
ncbi:MAG: hypothetical protein ABI650_11580, partial [Dokdonella sp.]